MAILWRMNVTWLQWPLTSKGIRHFHREEAIGYISCRQSSYFSSLCVLHFFHHHHDIVPPLFLWHHPWHQRWFLCFSVCSLCSNPSYQRLVSITFVILTREGRKTLFENIDWLKVLVYIVHNFTASVLHVSCSLLFLVFFTFVPSLCRMVFVLETYFVITREEKELFSSDSLSRCRDHEKRGRNSHI